MQALPRQVVGQDLGDVGLDHWPIGRRRGHLTTRDLLVLQQLEERAAHIEVLGGGDLDVRAGSLDGVQWVAGAPLHQRARVDRVVLAVGDGAVVQRQYFANRKLCQAWAA